MLKGMPSVTYLLTLPGMLSNLPSKQQVLSITSSEESPIHPDSNKIELAGKK